MHPSHGPRALHRAIARRMVASGVLVTAGLALPWTVTAAFAAPGDQSIVSLDENGNPATGGVSAISADGRYVVFDTYASLVSADTNTAPDVYVRDRLAGVTKLASVDDSGAVGNLGSGSARISDDGNVVVFGSDSTNLVAGDTNGTNDIFVHDFTTGQTTLVSRDGNGTQTAQISFSPVVSGNGQFVAFATAAPLVPTDTNNQTDVYRMRLDTMELDLVSRLPDGSAGSAGALAGISSDGQAVGFDSPAAFVAADTNNTVSDVYVRDFAAGELHLASVGPDGEPSNGYSGYAELSADGRYVTFSTQATNFGNPANEYFDVFWHDRTTGQTRRVSEAPNGEPQDGWSAHSSVSGDGRYVAFHSTSTNLAPAPDVDFWTLIFVRDMQTGAIVLAGPITEGGGADGGGEVPTISADGRFVTFYGYNSDFVGSGGFRGATYVYEIDFSSTTVPDVAIDAGPAGPTPDPDAQFSFSSTNNTATFECSLVQVGEPDEFTACTSPTPPTDLDDGDYVFKVRASAANLTSEPASRSFSVDTTGPSVSLEGGPAAVTNDNTPTLPFSAEPGTTFTCSLTRTDDDFQPCTSPITYPPQADGAVTFKVLGTDALGNVGPLTQYTFTIDASPASTVIVTAPAELTDDDTPTFEFSAEPGATFQCHISIGVHPFTPCTLR